MKDFRCDGCGRKLAEHKLKKGELAIKCPRCGKINAIEVYELKRKE